MIRRIGLLTVLASAAGIALAGPGGASAATTLGQTFEPLDDFTAGWTGLQAQSPGNQYAAPSPGIITSWSFQASASSVPQGLKLKVGRPAGGTDFTIVGESGPKNPTASQLNIYTDVSIPVQTGDVIGLYMGSLNANTYSNRDSDSGFGEVEDFGDFALGNTNSYGGPFHLQLDVSATVEPDADNDGFGDETQDQCPTNASTQGQCPASLTGQRAAALQRCKKKAKKNHWTKKQRKKCRKKAKKLPV
jgi:hypothetical protein